MAVNYKEDVRYGDWKEVSSSHISAIMWLRDTNNAIEQAIGRMYVEFNEAKKRIYLYHNVPYSKFYYFWRGAPSKGRYFHSTFRNEYSRYDIQGRVGKGVGVKR